MRLPQYVAVLLWSAASISCQDPSSSFSLGTTTSNGSSTTTNITDSNSSKKTTRNTISTSGNPVPKISGHSFSILPVGDSITMGILSSTGNGYRGPLFNLLTGSNTVTMMGGVEFGNMSQPWSDGYSGYIIETIQAKVVPHLSWQPSVILLCAGVNNLAQNTLNPAGALRNFINIITTTLPNTALLVSTIPYTTFPWIEADTPALNNQIKAMVNNTAALGRRVALVDQYAALYGHPELLTDGVHPNDAGYSVMANQWYKGINAAAAKGWISSTTSASNQKSLSQRRVCLAPTPNYIGPLNLPRWLPWGQLFDGAALGPSVFDGTICVATPKKAGQCNCDFRDGSKIETMNLTGPNCAAMSGARTRTIQFADVTGDGLSDLIHVSTTGIASIYTRTSATSTFAFLGNVTLPVGAHRDQIKFADLSGDGLADMLWVLSNGTVLGWRNGGVSGSKFTFTPQGVLTTGFAGLPGAGVRFWDVDGDGSMDYCYVDPEGLVQVAYGSAATGGAMQKSWSAPVAFSNATLGFRGHATIGDIQGDGPAEMIDIDRVTGNLTYWTNAGRALTGTEFKPFTSEFVPGGGGVQIVDLNGDGRVDFVYVNPTTSAVTAWRNSCFD